jgi:hypothetical protein
MLLRCSALLFVAVSPSAAAREYTAVIEHAGVGYGSSVFELRDEGDGRRSTHEESRIDVSANGSRETLVFEQRSIEGADGRPLWLWRREVAGPDRREAEARVVGGHVELRRRDGEKETRIRFALPQQWLVDAALARRIAEQPANVPWSFTYDELDPLRGHFSFVQLSSDGQPVDGVLELIRSSGDGDGRRSSRRLRWSLDQRRLLPSWNLGGAVFTSRVCDDDCDAVPRQYFDLIGRLTLASPYHFPAQARNKTLRYVFETTDGTAPALPVTGEQRVVTRGTRSIVTICADCGDEAALSAADLAHYRQANNWVQSDAAEIRALAHTAVAPGSIAARMHSLEQVVYRHMSGNRATLGYASALQALRSRSGDCTEFALLLAALARANGLPARVVAGLAYSSSFTGRKDVFSPHAWVQVWDGRRWRSFDAGLGDFESTHVALAIGDGSPEAYAGVVARMRQLRLVDAGLVEDSPP